MKNNRKYLFIVGLLSIFGCNATEKNQTKVERPNIIWLLADDLGYGDLGIYGGLSNTPNLDQLAENGIRFSQFYAGSSNCSPSRAGLMTGINPAILGMYNYRPPKHPLHLQEEEITMAELLKPQGYQTVHIGKWHLGALAQDTLLNHPQPSDQGFDYSLGTENNAQPSHLNPVNFIRNGKALGEQKGYACQLLADEAINWLNGHYQKEKPFFMYLPFHEPHAKVASPPELIAKYDTFSKRDANYLANIENLDLAIGRVLDYLKANDLMENSFIFFSSDNGSYRLASNGGLRAVKSYVYEGGIRVPAIIHYPKLGNEKKIIDTPLGFVDMVPTMCDMLEIKDEKAQPRWDGTSFWSLLNNQIFEREKPLYWFFYRSSPELALRIDNYVIMGKSADTIPLTHRFSAPDMTHIRQMQFVDYELYDLEKDTWQENNLYPSHPEANQFKLAIDQQLKEIQEEGYLWKNLPLIGQVKKLKKDWVKY